MSWYCFFRVYICRDVTYITASGSIIAAAGYSSSGVNVVIWDTLAPSATSRASIMCHEGFSLINFHLLNMVEIFLFDSNYLGGQYKDPISLCFKNILVGGMFFMDLNN